MTRNGPHARRGPCGSRFPIRKTAGICVKFRVAPSLRQQDLGNRLNDAIRAKDVGLNDIGGVDFHARAELADDTVHIQRSALHRCQIQTRAKYFG